MVPDGRVRMAGAVQEAVRTAVMQSGVAQNQRNTKATMTITIDAALEARLRERAEAEGLTVPAYVERLVRANESAEEELESLALDGLNSGNPVSTGLPYWEEKHRRLDDRVKKTGMR